MKEKNNLEKKIAVIESLVSDQGNGESWCSGCNYDITVYLRETLCGEDYICPNCGSYLVYGHRDIEPYPFGGSDFPL